MFSQRLPTLKEGNETVDESNTDDGTQERKLRRFWKRWFVSEDTKAMQALKHVGSHKIIHKDPINKEMLKLSNVKDKKTKGIVQTYFPVLRSPSQYKNSS